MPRQSPHDRHTTASAFTLVEMSVVLVIIGLLIVTVFPALTIARTSGQRSLTQSNLQSLMTATAAYVQANGCVPCPTPATISGAAFGHVRGDTQSLACNGCAVVEGIPPFLSLGIPANVAHDGWGRWITMRVDPALTTAALGTTVPPASPCTAADLAATPVTPTCALLNASQKGLCQTKLSATKRVNVSMPGGAVQQAAVLFVSHGSAGYGAFLADGEPLFLQQIRGCRLNFPNIATKCVQNLSCTAPNLGPDYAICNATGTNTFYNAQMQDGYDDMMLYADRNMLVSMLGNGSACQTVW